MSTPTTDPKSTARPPRVKDGVREGGQYDFAKQNEPNGSLTRTNNRLAAMTPVDVDTELAAHYRTIAPIRSAIWKQSDFLDEAHEYKRHMEAYPESQRYRYDSWKFKDVDAKIEKTEATLEELQDQLAAYEAEHITPLEDEYERRGRWSRFFLVTGNTGGHVHSSMRCSTCNPRTQFIWLVDEADKSEDEIVEKAGDGACTVCYSSAPVVDKRHPRPNPFEDPEVKAAREVRAREKAERDAAKLAKGIFSPTGGPVTDEKGNAFNTERAAETYMLREMEYIGWYTKTETEVAAELEAMANIQIALINKRGVPAAEIRASWTKKITDKVKRDSMDADRAAFMYRALDRVNVIVDSRDETV